MIRSRRKQFAIVCLPIVMLMMLSACSPSMKEPVPEPTESSETPALAPSPAPIVADTKRTLPEVSKDTNVVLCVDSILYPAITDIAEEMQNRIGLHIQIERETTEAWLDKNRRKNIECSIYMLESWEAIKHLAALKEVDLKDAITIAKNKLVLFTHNSSPEKDPIKLLGDARAKSVALPGPDLLVGVHSEFALKNLQMNGLVLKLDTKPSARAVFKAVQDKSALAGVGYYSELLRYPDLKQILAFPKTGSIEIVYIGIIPKIHANKGGLRQLLRYLSSQEIGTFWKKHGFSPPE